MKRKHAAGVVAVVMLVGWAACASAQGVLPGHPIYPPSTPIRRSIERIHKNTSPQPGSCFSVGYQTYLRDVAMRDLFKIDPSQPTKSEWSERSARFTHVEPEETACLEYVIPSNLMPKLASGAAGALDFPVLNTIAHARHYVYYDANPDLAKGRDWDKIADFRRGVVAAIYDLVDETDAIDPVEGVGTGTVVAVLRQSQKIHLPSGRW